MEASRIIDWINQCNASGLTRKEWCRLHGVSTKTFCYRQKKLRNEAFALSVKSDAQNKLVPSGTAFAEMEVSRPLPTGKRSIADTMTAN